MGRHNIYLALALCGWGLLFGPTPGATKERLTFGIIAPDHIFLRRDINRAMSKIVIKMNRDYNMRLSNEYMLFGRIMFVDQYSPPEILESFCSTILAHNMNTLLYMSNMDYEGHHTASGQYVLQVSNYLGIPVIAWNGDNSGFFQVGI